MGLVVVLFCQVALASGEGTFVDIVREAQLGSDLPNVECVDAKGLPLEPDGLHLSTPSQVRLGEMLANAFPESILSPTKASAITSNAPTMFASYISYFLLIQLLISLSIILTLTINFP